MAAQLGPSWRGQIRKVRVKLATGAGTAPPFAALEVTGMDADKRVTVKQPSADSLSQVVINGPLEILTDGEGEATEDYPTEVAYDTATGTPAVAEPKQSWGTAANSWKLVKDKAGFRPVGGAVATGIAVFERVPSGITCSCTAVPGGWTDLGTSCELDLIERACASDNSKVKRTFRICLTADGFKVAVSPWILDNDTPPAPP